MPTVTFHTLNQRFVEHDDAIPETARQVMYYSLAIGHHVGVIDCFQKLIVADLEDYKRFVAALPEGEAKRKFNGLIRFGEIVIDVSHVKLLATMLDENRTNFEPHFQDWADKLMSALAAIQQEPVMYIMAKVRED